MRVVSGVARGRMLRAPAGWATRPTSDRVREAVFSILTSLDVLADAVVLDLFAGSGAMGIEALSRGAGRVVFVDSDPDAVGAIRDNLSVIGDLAVRAEVVRTDALRYAAGAPPSDVTLADPPYAFDAWGALLDNLIGRTGLLVAEAPCPLDSGLAWETMKVKKYGGTFLTVARPLAGPENRLRQEGDT